ncbi:hypothetical protein FJZ39_01960 [Candidatus Saccharibacteria bacterium]|nr:hypothetical protein [Candidatus Saccharibacteria bacterium]
MSRPPINPEGTVLATSANIKPLKAEYLRPPVKTTDFTSKKLAGRLYAAAEGQLLVADRPNAVGGEAVAVEIPQLAAGRKESAYGVRFGQLALFGEGDSLASSELVALKSQPITVAARGMLASQYIRSTGVATAYETVGVLRESGESVSHVSVYKPEVITLDNYLWKNYDTQPMAKLETALAEAAYSLSVLHGVLNMSHGDAQAKNIAYSSGKDQPHFIDLDAAKRHDGLPFESADAHKLSDIEDFLRFQPQNFTSQQIALFAEAYQDYSTGMAHKSVGYKDILDVAQKSAHQPLFYDK